MSIRETFFTYVACAAVTYTLSYVLFRAYCGAADLVTMIAEANKRERDHG